LRVEGLRQWKISMTPSACSTVLQPNVPPHTPLLPHCTFCNRK
jgi:hypothetical protein